MYVSIPALHSDNHDNDPVILGNCASGNPGHRVVLTGNQLVAD